MGDVGPCGPCSEIHYDRIGGRHAAHLVNMDDPDVLEIWNLVFIQFNRESDGSLRSLPNKHIDTGLGLERVTSILQEKTSNYDTDLFVPLFTALHKATGARPYTGEVGAADKDGLDMAYRVVADHIRTLCIAISDGGIPSSVGRGYVLRRIIRRAVRYLSEKLDGKSGTFAGLVPTVIEILGDAFPELRKSETLIQEILQDEEDTFRRTLTKGKITFEKACETQLVDNTLPGAVAWKLYDTYGFPVDLVTLMAEERGVQVDMAGYEASKEEAKLISQGGGSKAVDQVNLDVHQIAVLKMERELAPTDDSAKYDYAKDKSNYYKFASTDAEVQAIVVGKEFVDSVHSESADKLVGVLLNKTCLYAEQGGQIYDKGFISAGDDVDFEVTGCQVYGGYVLHTGTLASGSLKVGDAVNVSIDSDRRVPVMRNHTATHLLNYALWQTLGDGVDQKGSLVTADRLRFDFSTNAPVKPDQAAEIEKTVNDFITKGSHVYSEVTPLHLANEIKGLRAVFGETYPDPVRVVSIGFGVDGLVKAPADPQWLSTSIEYCGGTHVENTADLQSFVLVAEEAVQKGVRRVVALTGNEAKEATAMAQYLKTAVDDAKKLKVEESSKVINALREQIDTSVMSLTQKDNLRKDLDVLKKAYGDWVKSQRAVKEKEAVAVMKKFAEESPDAKFLITKLGDNFDVKALQAAIKAATTVNPLAAVLVSSVNDGKTIFLANVGKPLVASGFSAKDWIASVSGKTGGKGGGKPLSAQCMTDTPNCQDQGLEIAREFALLKLSA
ncbi:alanyl-tRNA synthetase [Sphaeroforma arctica JP610]|uniref:Alanine--tRNA ligase n=1 Tax=Sphaeroforma arctica JP610 TaxID=667725 RepID=A0A0L0G033_9EUKA|nr:alanyl-tRNA synthetase [Sphaeroforma arctica JP610]KNC82477.1 alanyl-tRNA synthetase [Sphaeroforma arctica JP610]|eukprot:XP_014156379.1 alanyl-tRNA synthetase [Sphaeroforma arctica JP610]